MSSFFEQHTVTDVLKLKGGDAKLVSVDAKENFYTALWKLYKNGIMSAPVKFEDTYKVIDLADLITFAVLTFEERKVRFGF